MNKKTSRNRITLGAAVLIAGFLGYAFWPHPQLVDLARVERSPMMATIDEEARTRVSDVYVVSAPVSGRLLRVEVESGDLVDGQLTTLARILPSDPSFLDARAQDQAEADVRSAEAALELSRAEVQRAEAERDYAQTERQRAVELLERQAVSQAAVDRAELNQRSAEANLQTSRANVLVREAALENARARLMTPAEAESRSPVDGGTIVVRAPVSGRVLRVVQESETIIQAGAPILELGDPKGDLEVLAELLSTDAVKVTPGDRVIIDKWGGAPPLEGVVDRVEPFGFTKFSALGVEEQRVNVIIRFVDPPSARNALGHGYRVEARIVVWEDESILNAPSSALYRDGPNWMIMTVMNGRARPRQVTVGWNNGAQAEIRSGLEVGETVVLYPSDDVRDGARLGAR